MNEDLWGPSLPALSHALDAPDEVSVALPDRRYSDATTVGTGGMGRVEAVMDVRLERQVARKTVLDDALAERLLREARLTARLDHPGIVPVHDIGVDDEGRPFYTMRLVRGRSLTAVLRDLPASAVGERLALVDRVHAACQAMAYAHSLRIVHRDLKPDNLMVGPYGETLVVDWGLARALDDVPTTLPEPIRFASPGLTQVGAVLGTPTFMAPEQARGEPVDERADVFALGRVLQEVVGDKAPAELDAIVRRATAETPADRYADAGALEAELARWMEGRRVEAHDYALAELLALRLRPWRAPLAVAVALTLVGIAGLMLATVQSNRERERTARAEAEARSLLAEARIDRGTRALRDRNLKLSAEQLALARRTSPQAVGLEMAQPSQTPRAVFSEPRDCKLPRTRPGGGTLACLDDGKVQLRSVDGETQTWNLRASDATWLADGRLIVITDNRLHIPETPEWDLPRFMSPRRFERPPSGIDAVVVSTSLAHLITLDPPASTEITCPSGNGLLDIVPVGDGWTAICEEGLLLHGRGTHLLGQTPTEKRMLSIAWTGAHYIAGTLDRELLKLTPDGVVVDRLGLDGSGPINQLVALPGGRTVALRGAAGPAQIVDVASLAVMATLDLSRLQAIDAHTIEGTGLEEWARWDVSGLEVPAVRAQGGIANVTWTRSGTAVYGTGAGTVGFWDEHGVRERVIRPAVVKAMVQGPGEDDVVVGFPTLPAVTRVDRDGEEVLAELHTRSLSWTSDGALANTDYTGKTLVQREEGWVRSAYGGKGLVAQRGVDRMVFLDDAPWVSVGTLDHVEPLVDIRGSGPLTLSEGGDLLAYVDHTTLYVHEGDAPVRSFDIPHGVSSMAADDRGFLLLGYVDGTLRALSAADGALLAEVRVHEDRLSSFDVRGSTLLTGGWDKQVRRWSLTPLLDVLAQENPWPSD